MVSVFLRERRRRLVGIVRIVQVHPYEMRPGAVLLEPSFGVLDDFHAAALDASPALFLNSIRIRSIAILAIGFGKVIVEIEAAIEAGSERVAVENHRSNKSGGPVAVLLQQFRRRLLLRRAQNSSNV